MKTDAITSDNCKLAPGSLVTISVDLVDGCVVKAACVQRDYVITTRRRPFYWAASCHGCISRGPIYKIS